MCVIFLAQSTRPTAEMITAGFTANRDGGGMAWRDPDSEGQVQWHKGLTLEEMLQYADTLPLPYVMHFRVASLPS